MKQENVVFDGHQLSLRVFKQADTEDCSFELYDHSVPDGTNPYLYTVDYLDEDTAMAEFWKVSSDVAAYI